MDAVLDRPFYFIIVLWGARFRDYFLEYCVPSLLAPGNLPSLSTKTPSKFLIVTRPDDWAAIEASPIFAVLSRYVTPVYVEIAPCPPNRSGCQHMGLGHRIACDMAHKDKAYAAVLTPDCMLSDGSVARLQELARTGTQLVLTAALRFGEEPFLGHLQNMGVLPNVSRGATGTPLVISGRQMVYAAVNGFHSETLAYEWDAPGLMFISSAAWWRVPEEDGIVLHSLSWAPLLLDYGAIAEHDTSTLDQWTLDGDYLYNNAKDIKQIHVVQDSDELFIASWGPLDERPVNKIRFPFDKFIAGFFFKQSFYSGFFDPLKRTMFFLPVYWHSRPLNDRWDGVEAHAMNELLRWVEPPDEAHAASELRRLSALAKHLPLFALRSVVYVWIFRHRIAVHLGRLLRGDRSALTRIVWFARSFLFSTGRSS
ncbi:MAG TPA: hypothetical protein VMR17_17920 [Xanthobacteraceae bacterium]|nr:hypothetical protein [Xanthobacteraceae bacterium]